MLTCWLQLDHVIFTCTDFWLISSISQQLCSDVVSLCSLKLSFVFFQSSSWSASPWRDHKFASLHARSAMLRRKCGNANWQGASARTTRSSLIEYRPGSLARTMARECRPICKICIYNQYIIVVSWSIFLNTSLESCTGWCSGSYRWVWWYVWVLQLFTIVRKSFHNLLRILWQSLRIVLKSLRIFVKILKDFRENP